MPALLSVPYCRGLEGTIPDPGWTLPSRLQALNVSSSRLGGSLPRSWVLPAGLVALDASRNSLEGGLPPGWAVPQNASLVVLPQEGGRWA